MLDFPLAKYLREILTPLLPQDTFTYTSTKLASFFSLKDKIPNVLRSHVIYKFNCAGCTASYIGYTDILPLTLVGISTNLVPIYVNM